MPDQRISRRLLLLGEGRGGRKLPAEQQVLGAVVRTLRRRADLSQEALAARAGISAHHLGGIERGEHSPTFGTLLRLAAGLDMPLSQLIADYERVAPLPLLDTEAEGSDDRAA